MIIVLNTRLCLVGGSTEVRVLDATILHWRLRPSSRGEEDEECAHDNLGKSCSLGHGTCQETNSCNHVPSNYGTPTCYCIKQKRALNGIPSGNRNVRFDGILGHWLPAEWVWLWVQPRTRHQQSRPAQVLLDAISPDLPGWL